MEKIRHLCYHLRRERGIRVLITNSGKTGEHPEDNHCDLEWRECLLFWNERIARAGMGGDNGKKATAGLAANVRQVCVTARAWIEGLIV